MSNLEIFNHGIDDYRQSLLLFLEDIMPPIGEIDERNLPSGETTPASQSQMSGSSPVISRPSTSFESFRSSMAPEVSALFRLIQTSD